MSETTTTAPRPVLSEIEQRRLDQLYWDTKETVKSIAEQFGVPAQRLHTLVSPRQVGNGCWKCAAPLTAVRRSQRGAQHITCQQCSARTNIDDPPPSGNPDDALIVLGAGDMWSGRRGDDHTVEDCRHALTKVGVPWSGQTIPIDPATGGPGLVTLLRRAHPNVTILAIESIRSLAPSDTDAICTFASLVSARYRVISAEDFHAYGMPYRAYVRDDAYWD